MRESGADIDNGVVLGVGLIGAFLIAVIVFLAQAFNAHFESADAERKAQASPALGDYRAEQQNKTTRYRWVDQKGGVVAVPVDRAIELLAERGLPVPPPAEEPAPADDGEEAEEGDESDEKEGGDDATPTESGDDSGEDVKEGEAPEKAPEKAPEEAPETP